MAQWNHSREDDVKEQKIFGSATIDKARLLWRLTVFCAFRENYVTLYLPKTSALKADVHLPRKLSQILYLCSIYLY
jgi:hypothetical protein